MIDNFSLGLTHALLLYAAWKLMARPDLDREVQVEIKDQPEPEPKLRGWDKR
jgi:hypothetical protein